ncbi:hypothetical protein ACLB2K_000154 [Fragaria x ananassa]
MDVAPGGAEEIVADMHNEPSIHEWRLDTQSPLVPGEFVNGVPTELIKVLKEDIDWAIQLVGWMNKSSGIAHKLKKIIPVYSQQMDKVSSDFQLSLIVLTSLQSYEIKDDTTHIRALLETTDKKDEKMSLQLEQIFKDVSRLSTCSKTGRLHEDILSTCPKTGRLLFRGMLLRPDLEKDITSNFHRIKSGNRPVKLVRMSSNRRPVKLVRMSSNRVPPYLSPQLPSTTILKHLPCHHRADGIKAYVSQVQQLDDSIKTFIRQQNKLYKDFQKHLLDDSLRLEDFKLDDKFNLDDGKCFSIVVDGNCGGKYGGTLFDDILTNLTENPDGKTEEEVTAGTSTSRVAGVVAEEEDGETICGACRKCFGLAEYWIQCNICEQWFHGTCVHITPDTVQQHFRCHACSH